MVWLKSTNLLLTDATSISSLSFENKVDIIVHFDNSPFWIFADTNKDGLDSLE